MFKRNATILYYGLWISFNLTFRKDTVYKFRNKPGCVKVFFLLVKKIPQSSTYPAGKYFCFNLLLTSY